MTLKHTETEQVLRHFMQLELATTPASISDMAKLLALNYFSAVPTPSLRSVTMNDWQGLGERDADNAKASNLKRLQRWLDGTTNIPSALLWPWVNCLDTTREDCLAALGHLAGLVLMETVAGRHNTSLCASMRHFAEMIEHNATIFRDGVVDENDQAAVREFNAAAAKLQAAVEGFRRHLNQASSLEEELAAIDITRIGRAQP